MQFGELTVALGIGQMDGCRANPLPLADDIGQEEAHDLIVDSTIQGEICWKLLRKMVLTLRRK